MTLLRPSRSSVTLLRCEWCGASNTGPCGTGWRDRVLAGSVVASQGPLSRRRVCGLCDVRARSAKCPGWAGDQPGQAGGGRSRVVMSHPGEVELRTPWGGRTAHAGEVDCARWGGRLRTLGRSTAHAGEVDCAPWGGRLRTLGRSTAHPGEVDCAPRGGRLRTPGRSTAHPGEGDCAPRGGRLRTPGRATAHAGEGTSHPVRGVRGAVAGVGGWRPGDRRRWCPRRTRVPLAPLSPITRGIGRTDASGSGWATRLQPLGSILRATGS